MRRAWSLIIAIALAGCYATVRSSRAYLTPAQSMAVIPKPVGSLNTEIVRMFATRDLSLAEQRPVAPAGTVLLRFVGGRRYAGGEGGYGERHAIDSVYYVRVEPNAMGATVKLLGRAAVDGVEACTHDPDFVLACSALSPPEALADSVDGYREATVIHNVLVELEPATTIPRPKA